MSYSIRMMDKDTKETLKIPCDVRFQYDSLKEYAECNITYNYSQIFYKVLDKNAGIRKIYGMTGSESAPLLFETINKLNYTDKDTDIKCFKEELERMKDVRNNASLNQVPEVFLRIADSQIKDIELRIEKAEINGTDFIEGEAYDITEYNARYALIKLLVIALQCPDGVWDGD